MVYDDDLTEAQRKAVAEAEDAILRVLADARVRLAETGIDFQVPEEGDFSCTRCDCEFFMGGNTPGQSGLVCQRQTCRHSFTLHRVQ